ncbi:MAG: oligosaccharide flippase family protein [Microgenomates group bacterium]|nr:oligosaccharide flippase family protein [Microgenomates group bacterium]
MIKRAIDFIKRPTSLHIIINTFGNYLNVFFTAFFALILVRILNPDQYGVLSVLLGIAYVLANILDFGTTATIYSYLPPLIEKKAANLYRFIKSTFFYQTVFSALIIFLLFVFFPSLDKIFFKTGAPSWELYLTTFSVLFLIWQNFVLNILYAAKKYIKANLYLNLANIIKTLVVFFLIATKNVTIGSIIFTFGILGPIIFFLLLFVEKKDLVFVLVKSGVAREEFRMSFTLTYFISSQFFNLGTRMDLFLLSYFRSKAEVGYYGLAQKIILTIMTTVISITQVLSPHFSKIKTKKEVIHQFKSGFFYMLIPTSLFFILFILPDQIFYLFFTSKFAETATITHWLALAYLILPMSNLINLFLLYTRKKPVYSLYANIGFFLTLVGLCLILIPQKGAFGAIYAVAAGFFINFIIYLFSLKKELQQI